MFVFNFVGNLIWILCGGLISACCYIFGGIVLCLTIIGIPFGLQCFKMAYVMLFSFGTRIESSGSATGCFSLPANIIWLICGGLVAALNHIFWGILLFITIIGIPFARQHFKLVEISMMPFGKSIR